MFRGSYVSFRDGKSRTKPRVLGGVNPVKSPLHIQWNVMIYVPVLIKKSRHPDALERKKPKGSYPLGSTKIAEDIGVKGIHRILLMLQKSQGQPAGKQKKREIMRINYQPQQVLPPDFCHPYTTNLRFRGPRTRLGAVSRHRSSPTNPPRETKDVPKWRDRPGWLVRCVHITLHGTSVDGSEIPNNHQGWCLNPVNHKVNWCRISSISSIIYHHIHFKGSWEDNFSHGGIC